MQIGPHFLALIVELWQPKGEWSKEVPVLESFEAAQKWLKVHMDTIFLIYGPLHHIQQEDIFLGEQTYKATLFASLLTD